MTMAVAQNPPTPRWHDTAEPVDERGPGMLTIGEVANLTGLSSSTIQVALNSQAYTGRRSRLRELSQPKWNWQGVPLWSAEQVGAYHAKVAARWKIRQEFSNLPEYAETEVIRRQLASLRGLSRISGVPLTTLHRWKLGQGFPAPAALMKINSPTPRVLYSWPALRECMKRDHADWMRVNNVTAEQLNGLRVTDADE
jgi:hypothetical protein